MGSPIANFYGQGGLRVTTTVPNVADGWTPRYIDVGLGSPVLESLQDIASVFGLRSSLVDSNGQYSYTIVYNNSALDLGLTWAQQGVQVGSLLLLVVATPKGESAGTILLEESTDYLQLEESTAVLVKETF